MIVKTPQEVTAALLEAGLKKVSLPVPVLLVQAVQAGAFIAFGGVLSLIVGFGFPEATASNPSLQKLLSGIMFPIGLILVVVLGAELFTGNNAILMPGMLRHRITPLSVLRNWSLVYVGNFIGAVAFTYMLVYSVGLTSLEPYRSAIVGIATAKVSMPWLTVFLKGIGANWCVCLAVCLAISGHDLVEKMAGCFLPVMAFVVLGYEHCIANMFYVPAGMLEGADISMWTFLTANLIPSTLGNIVGGAVLVGSLKSYLYLKRKKC